MLIQYPVDADFHSVIDSIEKMEGEILTDGFLFKGSGREVSYHIQDHHFDSQANVTLQWQADFGYVAITLVTAMSGFIYTIKPSAQKGVCIVTYDGAYKGFLDQNLLLRCLRPPVVYGGSLVLHSLGCDTLANYAAKKGSAFCTRFIK